MDAAPWILAASFSMTARVWPDRREAGRWPLPAMQGHGTARGCRQEARAIHAPGEPHRAALGGSCPSDCGQQTAAQRPQLHAGVCYALHPGREVGAAARIGAAITSMTTRHTLTARKLDGDPCCSSDLARHCRATGRPEDADRRHNRCPCPRGHHGPRWASPVSPTATRGQQHPGPTPRRRGGFAIHPVPEMGTAVRIHADRFTSGRRPFPLGCPRPEEL